MAELSDVILLAQFLDGDKIIWRDPAGMPRPRGGSLGPPLGPPLQNPQVLLFHLLLVRGSGGWTKSQGVCPL